MTEQEIQKLQNGDQDASRVVEPDGSDEDKGPEPTAKKDFAKIMKQIENRDKVDAWVQHRFNNPAREDEPNLSHWTKEKEKNETYPFAKFNKTIEVIQFTEKEYKDVTGTLPRDSGK